MAIRNQFSYILLILLLFSCKTEDLMLKKLDIIPADKYYSTDIIPDSAQTVYGLWKFSSTSGGFSGRGFTIDFDYLILKPNAIFGLIKNDTLIAYGKLTLLKNTNDYFKHSLYCQFDFDQAANVQLAFDNEKIFLLETNDSLSLVAPCCDRYNMHFVRVNSDLDKSSKIGTLMGKISIGPLCPVETAPPQPGCLPTADTYKTWQLSVWNTTKTKCLLDIIPDLSGIFIVKLPVGKYLIDYKTSTLQKIGRSNLPVNFEITNADTTKVEINIDTGIR